MTNMTFDHFNQLKHYSTESQDSGQQGEAMICNYFVIYYPPVKYSGYFSKCFKTFQRKKVRKKVTHKKKP